MIAVGKRGGCTSTPQAFIEQLMIREARAGRFVVRLKGGDPFVFGRGGEEQLALREAGVDVTIVPGITSGLAAPASVGVPVTHRGVAHGVALVTAHAADEGAEPDWRALALSRLTLVIYMGMRRVDELRDKLVAAGQSPATPVAIVANATRSDQRALHTTVARMAEDAAAAGLAEPRDHRDRRRRRDRGSGGLGGRRRRQPGAVEHVQQRANHRIVLALMQVAGT